MIKIAKSTGRRPIPLVGNFSSCNEQRRVSRTETIKAHLPALAFRLSPFGFHLSTHAIRLSPIDSPPFAASLRPLFIDSELA